MILIVNVLFSVYYVLLALRALLPWFGPARSLVWLRPVYVLTDPVLNVVRLGLPPQKIGMDVSPVLAIIFFWLAQRVIISLLGG